MKSVFPSLSQQQFLYYDRNPKNNLISQWNELFRVLLANPLDAATVITISKWSIACESNGAFPRLFQPPPSPPLLPAKEEEEEAAHYLHASLIEI